MEKGNMIETKVMQAQESLEKRMNAMVNTNLMEIRGKVLDMEVSQSKYQEFINDKTEKL